MAIATDHNHSQYPLSPAPPVLLFAGLILWGWQTDFMGTAIVMGLLLESAYFIKWRIAFSDQEINHLADLSSVLLFLIIIYAFNRYSFEGIYKILALLPFPLFLLVLALRYSNRQGIKTSALFISIRRLGSDVQPHILYEIDVSLPYLFICLIAASVGNQKDIAFFVLSTLIIITALWQLRPKQFTLIQWLLPILCACGIAYLMQNGLRQLQEETEALFLSLFEQYGFKSRDPYKTTTSIGSLGRLKLSDRVVMWLQSDKKIDTPLYLREVSYSLYKYGRWYNPKTEFDFIQKTAHKNEWRINPTQQQTNHLEIGLYLDDPSAIIPTLDNIHSLAGKDLIQVETNRYGATRIEARTGWIQYHLGYSNQNAIDNIPTPQDLSISTNDSTDFKKIATELDLYEKTPQAIVATVTAYFKNNFYYSITQNQRYPKQAFLSQFLFNHKKGHCEYFATATALLLRSAGIPARYTVGYSVQEYSPWHKAYIVRARHAHAWVHYYLDNEWHLLDTTPAHWEPLEAADKTILEPLMDLIAWLRYQIISDDLKKHDERNDNNYLLLCLLLLLLTYLFFRLHHKKSPQTKQSSIMDTIFLQRYGMDSPLYPFIKKLEQQTDLRRLGETLTDWIMRTQTHDQTTNYIKLIALHNRYRFHPISDKMQDKQAMINQLKKLPS